MWLRALIRDERASDVPTTAILIAIGAVIGLAVLAKLGVSLYDYFTHVGQCLNGC